MREKIMVEVLAEEKKAKDEVALIDAELVKEFESKQIELNNSYNYKLETLSSEHETEKTSLISSLQSKFKRKTTLQSKNLSLYDNITTKQVNALVKKILLLISK